MRVSFVFFFFFLFNDTATTEIYTNRSSAASDVYKRQAVGKRRTRGREADALHCPVEKLAVLGHIDGLLGRCLL